MFNKIQIKQMKNDFKNIIKKYFFSLFFITFFISLTLSYQGYIISNFFGLNKALPSIILPFIVKEIAPSFSGIILSMQLTTFIVARIKIMNIRGELKTINTMGLKFHNIFSISFIIITLISFLTLNIFSIFSSIISVYCICYIKFKMSINQYIQQLCTSISIIDLMLSELKIATFSLITSFVSIFYGLKNNKKNSLLDINYSILTIIITIIIIDYLINNIIN